MHINVEGILHVKLPSGTTTSMFLLLILLICFFLYRNKFLYRFCIDSVSKSIQWLNLCSGCKVLYGLTMSICLCPSNHFMYFEHNSVRRGLSCEESSLSIRSSFLFFILFYSQVYLVLFSNSFDFSPKFTLICMCISPTIYFGLQFCLQVYLFCRKFILQCIVHIVFMYMFSYEECF